MKRKPGNFQILQEVTEMKSTGVLFQKKDIRWIFIFFLGIGLLFLWNFLFLNQPSLKLIGKAFSNSIITSILVILFSLLLGWLTVNLQQYLISAERTYFLAAFQFVLNLIRSIPQIIGILIGYVGLTILIEHDVLKNETQLIVLTALVISIFIFLEVVDLLEERISFFKRMDFYQAMMVCGISEFRIRNIEILAKNSMPHLMNKTISILGSSIFLQCSIDFILSVGLSDKVSSMNFPVTMGSLLAKIDSKQDILAIGMALTNPGYFSSLFFVHLQGITAAFLISFTLLCIYNISDGFSERKKL